ncbi:hypothetical protein [Asticcacaulis sp. YBE204]|uniref:hypothetical protein n=1 Tax=Asticcacaulis sp. YBE204 TaxID=1282363 RepID=UPI0003C3B7F2|nr:hypothetical protein [Asticcacaulis sp. YBE204]ESQ78727.1 hypothetical protein AEYBE204_12135 [Asticcacaulis sp. YBE204]
MAKTDDLPAPNGGGSEDNGNVHVDLKKEWKKRPGQYPEAGKQLGAHDTGRKPV